VRTHVLLFVFIFACVVHASYPSLHENSPFGVNNFKVVENKVDRDDEFEFRGICLFEDGYIFSLFNRTLNRRYWLGFGEIIDGVSVKKYDKKKCILDIVLPDGSDRNLQLNRYTFNPRHVQLARSKGNGMSVPEEARIKFLDAVCEEKK
jgi:hypothetical protein